MKKLSVLLATLPVFAFAHESHTTNTLVHAMEHNLMNPFFMLLLLAAAGALSTTIYFKVRKTRSKKQ